MPQIPAQFPKGARVVGGGPAAPNAPWTPKYPGSAISPQQGIYAQPSSTGAPYEPAPATSHVYGWKLLSGGFVSKFYAPSVGAAPGTSVVLMVAFKQRQKGGGYTNGIASEYEYYFSDPAVAEKYLNDFRTNPHPGHVVQALERAGVAYKRKS